MHVGNERTAGKVAVYHQFEDVVVQVVVRKVPIVFVGFIKEVEPVQALDPSHAHADIQMLGIDLVAALGVDKLVGADDVVLGHDIPIVGVAVDPGDLVGGKLENLENNVGPLDGPYGAGGKGQHGSSKQEF